MNFSPLLFTVITTLMFLSSWAQPFLPGQIHYGRNNYIEYRVGDLPVIITAPHGGYLEPTEIADRNCSGCVYGRDLYTQEMVKEIDTAFMQSIGGRPHIIINRLARIKLDANREIVEAAQGNQWAEQAWYEFHEFTEHAHDTVEAQFGRGLHIDLHGHGHTIQRLELGYLLSRTNLQLPDGVLNGAFYINKSSLKTG